MSVRVLSRLRRCAGLLLILLAIAGPGAPRAGAQPPAWLLADLLPGSLGSHPGGFRAHGALTFFVANAPSAQEVWRTDGTAAGTLRVHAEHNVPLLGMASFGDQFVFVRGPVEQPTFWQTDGTPAGTQSISTLALPAGYRLASPLIPFQDTLVFLAVTLPDPATAAWAVQLWQLDDLAGPPQLVTTLADQRRFDQYIVGAVQVIGDQLYLWDQGYSGSTGIPQWHSAHLRLLVFNGQQVTVRARCTLSEAVDPPCGRLIAQDTAAVYTANGLLHRETATAHTVLDLADLGVREEAQLALLGGQIMLGGADTTGRIGIWRTDGTLAGTQRLLTAGEPSNAVGVEPPVVIHGRLYLAMWPVTGPATLWQTDGTVTGTRAVALPGSLGAMRAVGSTLVLSLNAPATGQELWAIAGPDQPPQLVADIWPGPDSSQSNVSFSMAQHGNGLIFGADDGVHGAEPRWVPFGQPLLSAGWAGAGPGRPATIPVRLGPGLAAPQPLTLTLTLPPELTLLDHSLGITPTISGGTVRWPISGLAARTQQVRLTIGMPAAALGTAYTATLSVAPYGVAVPLRLAIAHEQALPLVSRPPAP